MSDFWKTISDASGRFGFEAHRGLPDEEPLPYRALSTIDRRKLVRLRDTPQKVPPPTSRNDPGLARWLASSTVKLSGGRKVGYTADYHGMRLVSVSHSGTSRVHPDTLRELEALFRLPEGSMMRATGRQCIALVPS